MAAAMNAAVTETSSERKNTRDRDPMAAPPAHDQRGLNDIAPVHAEVDVIRNHDNVTSP
jgi:hypothetical protein